MKVAGLFAAVFALMAIVVIAQPPRNDGDSRPGPPLAGPPLRDAIFQLLDTDQDGEITFAEIDNAPQILKQCDRDGNGILTPDELPRPPRPDDEQTTMKSIPKNAPVGTVVFSGGYETDPQDGGRPVALIAAALGVETEVFRQAFSGVRPARGGGGPTAEQARANKKVLMEALGKYGITNERLDTVSNYYRYNPGAGDVWKHTPATATAVIKDGKVMSVTLTEPGSGYMTVPMVTIAGYEGVKVQATLRFTKDFKTNGSIETLNLTPASLPRG